MASHARHEVSPSFLFAGVDRTEVLYLKLFVLKGLHYIAATATTGETHGAVILRGGCAGRCHRNASRSRRCSGSGCVVRDKCSERPSVVGIWTSTICMVLNVSIATRGVKPGARCCN